MSSPWAYPGAEFCPEGIMYFVGQCRMPVCSKNVSPCDDRLLHCVFRRAILVLVHNCYRFLTIRQ